VTGRVELYDRLPVTADVGWWRERAEASPDGRVLYVGAGTGRLAVPVAEVTRELVAVDNDPGMLAAFRTRLEATDPALAGRVRLVEADAASLSLVERFGLVVLPSNLLNGITDPAARAAAAKAAAAHCLPDGHVVMQVLNPYWLACDDPSARGRIQPDADAPPIDVAIRRHEFDTWEQRAHATITYRFADGAELVDEIDAIVLYPRELRALVYQAGLKVVDRWGAVPGEDALDVAGGTWHLVCAPR
jgi:SAM-dependent methyltransferase